MYLSSTFLNKDHKVACNLLSINQCEVLSAGGGKADTFDINTVQIGNPVEIFSIDCVCDSFLRA